MMISVDTVIQSGGLLAIGVIIFSETGLLVGMFLPGDTLLFNAGLIAATGRLNIVALLITLLVGAVAGNTVGYEIGKKTGHLIFKKEDGIFFRKEYILKANEFYVKHGGKTVILSRFIPIVRTFAPLIAGVGKMDRKIFFAYNIIGALLWTMSVTLLGFWLGNRIPNVSHYVAPIFLLAIFATWAPVLYHILKDPISRKKIKAKLSRKVDL
jgi:membrane-associated protein